MITEMISFFAPGQPKTKGSLDVVRAPSAGRKAVVREGVRGSGAWRRLVAERARVAMAGRPAWGGPVGVRCSFMFATDNVMARHVGDLDKLARNVLDALTDAHVYLDDSQVVKLFCDKVVEQDGTQGVQIEIYAASAAESP